jgi:hypothetical protein
MMLSSVHGRWRTSSARNLANVAPTLFAKSIINTNDTLLDDQHPPGARGNGLTSTHNCVNDFFFVLTLDFLEQAL